MKKYISQIAPVKLIKKLKLDFWIIIILTFTNLQGQSVVRNPFDVNITGLTVINRNKLFFVGYSVEAEGVNSFIYVTTDGGLSWRKRFVAKNTYFDKVHFINKKIGIISAINNKKEVLLLKTLDSGRTWIEGEQNIPDYIEDMQFLSETEGYAICSDGKFLTTNDQGNTWRAIKTPIKNANSINFKDSLSGWVLTDDGDIYETNTRGNEWVSKKEQFLELLGKWNPSEIEFKQIKFIDSKNGYLAVRFLTRENKKNNDNELIKYDGGVVFSTNDGGKKWNANVVTTDLGMWDALFSKNIRFWVLPVWGYREDIVFSSSNSGKTWDKESIKGIEGIPKIISFINNKVGWLITDGGGISYIYRTVDGGKSWK